MNNFSFKVQPLANDEEGLHSSIVHHIGYSLAKDEYTTTMMDWYKSTAYAVRDRLMHLWHEAQRSYYDQDVKRVYYFSMEFLMGRSLSNNMINLGLEKSCHKALHRLGQNLEDICEEESDAGLGNGGLGRLAACFLDSMATLNMPAYGYGLRYEYGIFAQDIVQGEQVENADHWLQFGNVWEIERPENSYLVRFGGTVKPYRNDRGEWRHVWLHDQSVMALAYDTPVVGYHNQTVNTLRLWSAKAMEQFNFSYFNEGDYIKAVEERVRMENISRVLYPDDSTHEGKMLRFKQQYFFVSASLQDILRRYKKERSGFKDFPNKVAIQLNDTHPSLAILELMRLFLDVEGLLWDEAWAVVNQTFAYTNHTVLPEALEKWSVSLFEVVLPRHLQILYEINQRFLTEVARAFPKDEDVLRRMSLIEGEGEHKCVRMAYLAIVGSHAVNGVAKLHSDILKEDLFQDFYRYQPQKFLNITNGISPRRWLFAANPRLAALITDTIGDAWTKDLMLLENLKKYADDKAFLQQWREVKHTNKMRLVNYVEEHLRIHLNPHSLFDVQVKRIHEYKRQLLNILHVIHYYRMLKVHKVQGLQPRTFIFAGKAAPGYRMAKLVIHLINAVAEVVNRDPDVQDVLKVVFVPNYGVSLAEIIMPATDLSEQISTAGMEASGTGNMKFALNGALTIATLDGANVEIAEHVGAENMFIFGLTSPEVAALRKKGYEPMTYYEHNPYLKEVIDLIMKDTFSAQAVGVFKPILDELLNRDYFLNMVDFANYVSAQEKVNLVYSDPKEWARKSVLNVAGVGMFSSDRAVQEYTNKIWLKKEKRL